MSEPARGPGRPRDHRLDEALLEAGLAVFLEVGYGTASLAEIARRAGVGTPAIYRRWPTKADMAIGIVEHVSEAEAIPDTGSIRDDLVAFMALRLRTWRTPLFRKLVVPVLMEGHREGSVATDIGARFLDYRKALEARIGRSIEAGELRAGTIPSRLIDLLMGTITMPLLFFQQPPAVDEASAIVDQVLSGFGARDRGPDHST
ncbi:MAG TPA: TetR/AcrR family transcriptional regulator [Candidatus Acidoferrum sp.]|jgi:AcrR family transcriptional regulator|nr:TetR/AcrR family transcriptional regulator [Candidatus Acidoferrum sp.]